MADAEQPDYTNLTVQLLSAYVANNTVASEDLAGLIQSTRAALVAEAVATPVETVEHVPAVSVRKSVASRDHILSLIDGRPYKTLKRHLATHGLTPADYRARYGLPETYPMVAQAYSEQRRAVAQKLGLGQRGTQARLAAAEAAATPAPVTSGKAKAAAPKAKTPKPAAAPKSKAKAAVATPAPAADAPAPKPVDKAAAPAAKPADQVAAPAAKPATKPARKAKATASAAQPAPDAPAVAEPAKAKSPAKSAPRKKLGIKADAAS